MTSKAEKNTTVSVFAVVAAVVVFGGPVLLSDEPELEDLDLELKEGTVLSVVIHVDGATSLVTEFRADDVDLEAVTVDVFVMKDWALAIEAGEDAVIDFSEHQRFHLQMCLVVFLDAPLSSLLLQAVEFDLQT